MTPLPQISTLLAFEAVARRRSFALAAAELHLTASAISHQIARLEFFLGVKLFDRHIHGVRLSTAGENYLRRVGGALGAISAATDDVRQGVRNSLYVHSAPSFASLWLMPRLAKFAQTQPEVSLFLSASHVHSDFGLGQADVDIRYGVPQWPDLVVQPLFDERILPLASPAFLERQPLREPADLLQAPLIQSAVGVLQWSDWLSAQDVKQTPERFALRFDRAQLAIDAAVQGLGVALESAVNAAPYIERGALVPPFGPARALMIQAHFIVYPAHHGKRPEVEAFVQWLRAQAQAMPDPFLRPDEAIRSP